MLDRVKLFSKVLVIPLLSTPLLLLLHTIPAAASDDPAAPETASPTQFMTQSPHYKNGRKVGQKNSVERTRLSLPRGPSLTRVSVWSFRAGH